MTSTTEANDIKTLFAAMAVDDVPPSDTMPAIDEIVAAILSKDHSLSAEQLMAFETLLDAPDVDHGEKQELLQTLWNLVVSIIDHQWKQANASGAGGLNACGSIAQTRDQTTDHDGNLLQCSQAETQEGHSETAAHEPRRKGRHDD